MGLFDYDSSCNWRAISEIDNLKCVMRGRHNSSNLGRRSAIDARASVRNEIIDDHRANNKKNILISRVKHSTYAFTYRFLVAN